MGIYELQVLTKKGFVVAKIPITHRFNNDEPFHCYAIPNGLYFVPMDTKTIYDLALVSSLQGLKFKLEIDPRFIENGVLRVDFETMNSPSKARAIVGETNQEYYDRTTKNGDHQMDDARRTI